MEIKTKIIQVHIENIEADVYSTGELFKIIKNTSENLGKYPKAEMELLIKVASEKYFTK